MYSCIGLESIEESRVISTARSIDSLDSFEGINVHTYVYLYMYVYVCIYSIYVCNIYIYKYIYIYIYIYAYKSICIHVGGEMHIHMLGYGLRG
jgi:hypothetical protein